MREYQNIFKQATLFVPVALGCVALAILGALFLQGYDSGNALPHTGNGPRFVDLPDEEPVVDSIDIADTSNLPDNMPTVPTPAKQAVMHAMQRKEQPKPQTPRPLPEAASPVAEHVTEITPAPTPPTPEGQVLGTGDANGDKQTDPSLPPNATPGQNPTP